jgi:hypothetical protein
VSALLFHAAADSAVTAPLHALRREVRTLRLVEAVVAFLNAGACASAGLDP